MPLVDGRMGRIGEVALQVQKEHPASSPVSPVVPVKLLLQTVICPVEPLASLAGPIVVDHARLIKGYEHFVAEGLVDLSVGDVRGVNGPYFSPLSQREVCAFLRLPSSLQDFPPAAGRPGKKVQFKVLGTLFPAHPVAALFPPHEHLPKGKGLLQAAQAVAAGLFFCLPLCLAAPVSRFVSLSTRHNIIRQLRTDKL